MYRKLIRAVACLLLAAMLLPLSPVRAADGPDAVSPPAEPQSLSGFTDTRGHWAWAWIELAYKHGLVAGVSQTRYAPNNALTRAMFVTLLYRACGAPEVSLTAADGSRKAYFSDVEQGRWYEIPVIWAYETGLTSGVQPGLFCPDQPATREQMCVFLVKFALIQGVTLPALNPRTPFTDDAEIAAWAKDCVYVLQQSGLVSGVGGGRFNPKKSMTRAEAAVVLVAYLRLAGKLPPTENLVDPTKDIGYEQMMTDLQELAVEYPGLIGLSSAGTSYEGRDIPAVTLGKGSKYVYSQANTHAREHQTTNFVLECLDVFAYAYETRTAVDGYDVRSLLNEFTIVFLPRVNPDGANIAQNGFDAAKNPAALRAMTDVSGKGASNWKANAQGTDINRNFPCYWAQLGTGPASEGYGGPYACSAPETGAVISAMKLHSYVCFLDIHMAGNKIYFCNPGIDSSFYDRSKAFAQRLCNKTGYELAYSDNIKNDHSGAAYARNEFRKPSLTVELTASTVFPHNSAKFYSEIWPYVKDLYLEAMTYYK